jgi:hypothetical protein
MPIDKNCCVSCGSDKTYLIVAPAKAESNQLYPSQPFMLNNNAHWVVTANLHESGIGDK